MIRWGALIVLCVILLYRVYGVYVDLLAGNVDVNLGSSFQFSRPFFIKSTLNGDRMEFVHEGQTYLLIFSSSTDYEYGDLIWVNGEWASCHSSVNPGTFNYCSWLKRTGISGTFFVNNHELRGRVDMNVMLRVISNLPRSIMQDFIVLSAHRAPIIYTMIFGARQDYISKDVKQSFQGLGLIHLLVVSGAQSGLITVLVWRCLRVIRIHVYFSMLLLWLIQCLYLCIVGLDASILRSLIMLNCFLWHRYILLGAYPLWWYLWFAIILVVVILPNSVLTVGFWYSFFITFNLMIFTKPLMEKIKGPRWFVGYVMASIIAVISSFPIQILSNSMIDFGVMSANLWVSWIGTAILFVGLFGYLIWLMVPIIGGWLFLIVNMLCDVLMGSLELLDGLSVIVSFDRMESIGVMLTSILFVLGFCLNRVKGLLLFSLIVWVIFKLSFRYSPRIIAIDVGQGDSTLVMVDGVHILIDTGGVSRGKVVATETIIPVLNYYGINRLDYVIITHNDLDHVGGLVAIEERLPIRHLIQANSLGRGIRLDMPDFVISVINPSFIYPVLSENDRSLCIRMDVYDWSILMTGDMDEQVELQLIRNGYIDDVDIYKLGHHGSSSSTSDELLLVSSPQFVWNSSGRHNIYGHPHLSVLNRLNKYFIPWLSTHVDGAISMIFSEDRVVIESFLSHRRYLINK